MVMQTLVEASDVEKTKAVTVTEQRTTVEDLQFRHS